MVCFFFARVSSANCQNFAAVRTHTGEARCAATHTLTATRSPSSLVQDAQRSNKKFHKGNEHNLFFSLSLFRPSTVPPARHVTSRVPPFPQGHNFDTQRRCGKSSHRDEQLHIIFSTLDGSPFLLARLVNFFFFLLDSSTSSSSFDVTLF